MFTWGVIQVAIVIVRSEVKETTTVTKSRRLVNFDALLGGENRVQMGVLEGLGGLEDLHDEINRGRERDVGRIGGARAAGAGGNQATNAPEGIGDYGARVATFGENAGIAVHN